MIRKPTQQLLALLLMALSNAAFAHAVWLERDAKQAYLYYGEYDEAKRETSPGRLDDIGTPVLFVNGQSVNGVKTAKGWRFDAVKKGELRAEAAETPVRDWRQYGIGIVKPFFYARHLDTPLSQTPASALDLVSTGKAGEFRLFLNGQPLGGSKIIGVAPNGWTREIKTDAEGKITLDMPWRGVYVMEATHVQAETGEYQGVAYEGRRMRATLSYHQKTGVPTFSPKAEKPAKY